MRGFLAGLILLGMLGPFLAAGQAPPSGIMPGSGMQMPGNMPVAADPDTVSARLVLPEGWADPVGVSFLPDTVTVGTDAWLRLTFAQPPAPEALATLLDTAEFSSDWVGWVPGAQPVVQPTGAVDLPVKIYQINPFRLEAGGQSSQVVLVDFRTTGVQETAGIRDPRRWGWNLLTLAVAALLLTAVLLLAWWIWTARKVVTEKLPDWEVPSPAWLAASLELQDLHDGGILERGQGRDYLDRLAGICRRYLAGRFHVGAVEMTGPEIARACAERGHPLTATVRFTSLLAEIDSSRYDPQLPSANDCRRRGRDFMAGLAEVRIIPRYTPVPAALALAAQKAWSHLTLQLLKVDLPRDDEAFAPGPGKEGL